MGRCMEYVLHCSLSWKRALLAGAFVPLPRLPRKSGQPPIRIVQETLMLCQVALRLRFPAATPAVVPPADRAL